MYLNCRCCIHCFCVLAIVAMMGISCKTKHIDSEPFFIIKFYKNPDSSVVKKGFCFDSIYGSNKKLHPVACFDSISVPIRFALNITEDSSMYFFKYNNRKDTLCIHYKVVVGKGEAEFKPYINNYKVRKITFKQYHLKSQENAESNIKDIDVYI